MLCKFVHLVVLTMGVGLLAAAASAGESLYPAEMTEISNFGSTGRLLVRFDLGRVKNSQRITKARLRLEDVSPAGDVEVRPLAAAWGSMADGLAQRQAEGVWRDVDLKAPDYKVAAELFLVGLPVLRPHQHRP